MLELRDLRGMTASKLSLPIWAESPHLTGSSEKPLRGRTWNTQLTAQPGSAMVTVPNELPCPGCPACGHSP